MMALDNQPYLIVQNRGFQRLMNHTIPCYKIPSRTYFSDKIVPDIYERMKEKIAEKLAGIKFISLTSDIWTSDHNNESFISITGRWLSESWTRNNFVLNCSNFKGSHTGVNIATKIDRLLDFWNVEKSKIHLMLRDSGANMIKGCNDCRITHESCFIHSLQLVVNKGLQSQRVIIDMLAVARRLAGHFNHSPVACEKLQKIQNDLNMPHKKIVQDVSTRWNSSFYMLERMEEQKRCLNLYCAEVSNVTCLSKDQWNVLSGVLDLLRPFEEVTRSISSTDSTISDIIPAVASLNLFIEKNQAAGLGKMRDTLQAELKKRFGDIEENNNYKIATLMDPRYKLAFFSTTYKAENRVNRDLMNALAEISTLTEDGDLEMMRGEESDGSSNCSSSRSVDGSPLLKKQKQIPSIWNIFTEISTQQTTSTKKSFDLNGQINSYLSLSLLDRESDPFKWWSENAQVFSELSKLAWRYLSAPGSSVYSERLFSEAGNIYEDNRSRLLPVNAEKLLFIHHNLARLNFTY